MLCKQLQDKYTNWRKGTCKHLPRISHSTRQGIKQAMGTVCEQKNFCSDKILKDMSESLRREVFEDRWNDQDPLDESETGSYDPHGH